MIWVPSAEEGCLLNRPVGHTLQIFHCVIIVFKNGVVMTSVQTVHSKGTTVLKNLLKTNARFVFLEFTLSIPNESIIVSILLALTFKEGGGR